MVWAPSVCRSVLHYGHCQNAKNEWGANPKGRKRNLAHRPFMGCWKPSRSTSDAFNGMWRNPSSSISSVTISHLHFPYYWHHCRKSEGRDPEKAVEASPVQSTKCRVLFFFKTAPDGFTIVGRECTCKKIPSFSQRPSVQLCVYQKCRHYLMWIYDFHSLLELYPSSLWTNK